MSSAGEKAAAVEDVEHAGHAPHLAAKFRGLMGEGLCHSSRHFWLVLVLWKAKEAPFAAEVWIDPLGLGAIDRLSSLGCITQARRKLAGRRESACRAECTEYACMIYGWIGFGSVERSVMLLCSWAAQLCDEEGETERRGPWIYEGLPGGGGRGWPCTSTSTPAPACNAMRCSR